MCCTEAGKLALNFVRPQSENEGDDIENHMTAAEEEVVTETRSDSEDTVNEVGDRSGSWVDLRYYPIPGVLMLRVGDNGRVVLPVLLVQIMNGCFLETSKEIRCSTEYVLAVYNRL